MTCINIVPRQKLLRFPTPTCLGAPVYVYYLIDHLAASESPPTPFSESSNPYRESGHSASNTDRKRSSYLERVSGRIQA